jgi:hypothetical protein
MKRHLWRGFVLGIAITCLSCSDNRDTKDAEIGDAQGAPTGIDSRPKDLKQLGMLADIVVAEVNDLPRAEFDPGALVEKIGKDPQELFIWVRDRTYWVPYRGLLRGSKGVMLDRVGSSLDRAVLLGDLLRHAGHTVRLARAQLSDARARELLGMVRPVPVQRYAPVARNEAPSERQRALAALIPDFQDQIEREAAAARRIKAEATKLVSSQGEMLLAAVKDAATPGVSEDGAAIAAVRDHWWVEYNAEGDWVAMDVLLPSAEAGRTLAPVSTTSEWKAGETFPSIPEADWHTVELRVVIERYEAGATREFTVLEFPMRPAETLDVPIVFGHRPSPWPENLPIPASPELLSGAALAVKEWVPYIQAGDELIVQSGFSIEGEELPSPLESQGLGQVGGAEVAGGMDMALGGFGEGGAVPAVTAEWLDFEIRVPGSPPEQLRRPVFDLLGPARRASKASDFDGTADLRKLERFEALYGYIDILLQPCDFTDDFVADLLSAGVVANRVALQELANESDSDKLRQLASEILDEITSWGPLPSLVLWRSALASPSGDAFLSRPNVLSYSANQVIVGGNEFRFRALIDLASNSTSVRRGADRSSFEIRLRQGVADTVAEMAVLGSDMQMAENTASVFARLATEGSRGQLIAARDVNAARGLPWPEDEAARVAADVERGYIALVPRKAVLLDDQQRVGWWRVDPVSGETVGVMDTGFHQGGENTITRARVALRVLRDFERRNRRHIRTVLQNPNSFRNQEVQAYRSLVRTLREVKTRLNDVL